MAESERETLYLNLHVVEIFPVSFLYGVRQTYIYVLTFFFPSSFKDPALHFPASDYGQTQRKEKVYQMSLRIFISRLFATLSLYHEQKRMHRRF